jgi:hypothetical protein
MLDTPGPVDAVLEPVAGVPPVVLVDERMPVAEHEPGSVVITYADLRPALRAARAALRESGGGRIRVHSPDPGVPVRVAAALPVTRVAVGDGPMPPPAPDGLLTWTRIGTDRLPERAPWAAPGVPVPAYPHASNEVP